MRRGRFRSSEAPDEGRSGTLWANRHRGEQCWCLRRRRHDAGAPARRELRNHSARQPNGHFLLLPRGRANHVARWQWRVDHQHRFHRRHGRHRKFPSGLSIDQGSSHQPHAQPGMQLGRPRSARQHAGAGLVSQRDDRRRDRLPALSPMGRGNGAHAPFRAAGRTGSGAAVPRFRRFQLRYRQHAGGGWRRQRSRRFARTGSGATSLGKSHG